MNRLLTALAIRVTETVFIIVIACSVAKNILFGRARYGRR